MAQEGKRAEDDNKYMKIFGCVVCLYFLACAHFQPQFIKNINEDKAAAIYERGDNYFKEKDYNKAITEFEKIINNYQRTDAYEPALYLSAFCHFKLNDYEKAVSLGDKFIKEFPKSMYFSNILALLGESYFKLADDYKTVDYLAKYYTQTEDTTGRIAALETILKVLPDLSIAQLEKLHRIFIADPIDEHILHNLVQAEISEGKEKDAQRDFNLLTRRFPNSQYTYEFGEYRRFVSLGETSGRAGVLLPLTGKFSNYGQKLMEIIRTFEKNKGLSFSMYPMDTKSDPIEAIIAATNLIEEKHIDFLIGPLFSIEAFGVCGLAYGKGIPVIIPTSLEPRFETIPLVFTATQNNEQQARVVAQYAARQLDLSRFAVIYPDLAKYKAISQAFLGEIRKYNGEVVATESFDPDSITLKWQLERIKKKNPEAIFLAMDTDMIINTAPQIAYYGLEKIRLLGIETFNNEKVPRLGEKYVEGGIFAAPSQIDTAALKEFKNNDLKEDDFISIRFFQTLWKLKELKGYSRINLNELLTNILRGKEIFNIYQIRDGEFVKLTEITEE